MVEKSPFPPIAALSKGLSIRGYTLQEVLFDPKLRETAERYVFDCVNSGKFKPRVDRVFPFEQIAEAHAAWSRTSRSERLS
jgi:NADPH:quinone reductase-like Zn-dependent oxidoreductase